ncbi:MAG: creatinine amidohydrolase [Halobacteriales archaeon]|jgi:creatinine amidohydrolase
MNLDTATWTDVAVADTDLALLPVGSTEQHGPHAPLGTDAITAEAVAEAGADASDANVVIAPTVNVGISEEHRHFPGSLWVSEDTFRAYIRETAESLAVHGFGRIVLVNGHGGNAAALREVAAGLTRNGDAYTVPFTWFDAVDVEVPMGHAGGRETGLLREVAPETIHEDRVETAAADASDRWGDWVSGVNLAYDTGEFTENGVVGDPRKGTVDLGERMLETAADALAELLAAIEERDLDEPNPR